MFKFITDYFKENRKYWKDWENLNKEAKSLTGLKRLLVYQKDFKHAGVYSTITDIVDTLEEHEKRIKELEEVK